MHSGTDNHLTTAHAGHSINIPSPPPSSNQRAGMHSPPPRRAAVREFSGTYESLPARSVQVGKKQLMNNLSKPTYNQFLLQEFISFPTFKILGGLSKKEDLSCNNLAFVKIYFVFPFTLWHYNPSIHVNTDVESANHAAGNPRIKKT